MTTLSSAIDLMISYDYRNILLKPTKEPNEWDVYAGFKFDTPGEVHRHIVGKVVRLETGLEYWDDIPF